MSFAHVPPDYRKEIMYIAAVQALSTLHDQLGGYVDERTRSRITCTPEAYLKLSEAFLGITR